MYAKAVFSRGVGASTVLFLAAAVSYCGKPEIPPNQENDSSARLNAPALDTSRNQKPRKFPMQRYAEKPEQAAALALAYLKKSGHKDSLFAKFGFSSLKELKSAKLGEPLSYFILSCDFQRTMGKKIETESDLAAISSGKSISYPVLTGNEQKMGIWVDSGKADRFYRHNQDRGAWTLKTLGGASVIKRMAALLRELDVEKGKSRVAMMEWPSLSQRFLVEFRNEEMSLWPLGWNDNDGCQLRSGGIPFIEAAEKVFACMRSEEREGCAPFRGAQPMRPVIPGSGEKSNLDKLEEVPSGHRTDSI